MENLMFNDIPKLIFTCFMTATVLSSVAYSQTSSQNQRPDVMLWRPEVALQLRQMALASDPNVMQTVKDVCKEADDALKVGPFSVTDKTFVPPSADQHDFSTIGRYWWPDPTKPDGLPWIRKDGQTNPEYFNGSIGDTQRMLEMRTAVNALARAWYVTDNEPYARKAIQLLRVWFINPDTRMNPNAKYAARFPGHWDGKSWGIHGTRHLTEICDSVGLLTHSSAWTDADSKAMRDWMATYLDWLLTSENGIEEGNTQNNHGTAFDWLVVRLAVFCGKVDLAKQVLQTSKTKRIAAQIEADGSMPLELARAKGWRYEGYAMEYMIRIALLGDQLDVDLWHYQADNGASIRKGLDYIIKHIQPQPGQIDPKILNEVGVKRIGPLASIASEVYNEPAYHQFNKAIEYNDVLRINFSGPNPQLCLPGIIKQAKSE
tara:strand:- start:370 stop:1662 length:1293 start_codon:yes stop_codon:yes gene_type:complete